MKLFIGSGSGSAPAGYARVAAEAAGSMLAELAEGAAEAIYADHVLQELDWPDALPAVAMWARALRMDGAITIAVPDIERLGGLLAVADDPWRVMRAIYGGGRFGYTRRMLDELLGVLGFGDVAEVEEPDACRPALRITGVKRSAPRVDVSTLAAILREDHDFGAAVQALSPTVAPVAARDGAETIQHMHMSAIEPVLRAHVLKIQLQAGRSSRPA